MAVLHYNFHTHPKIAALPKATIGVYALALSYCSANLTDGSIPTSYARQLDAKRQHFGRLTSAGLLAKRPDGYQVHDYLDYNPSKSEVEEKRAEARERMRNVRANKRGKKQDCSREQMRDVTQNVHDIGKDNTSVSTNVSVSSTDVTSTEDVGGQVIDFPAVEGFASGSDLMRDFMERRTG